MTKLKWNTNSSNVDYYYNLIIKNICDCASLENIFQQIDVEVLNNDRFYAKILNNENIKSKLFLSIIEIIEIKKEDNEKINIGDNLLCFINNKNTIDFLKNEIFFLKEYDYTYNLINDSNKIIIRDWISKNRKVVLRGNNKDLLYFYGINKESDIIEYGKSASGCYVNLLGSLVNDVIKEKNNQERENFVLHLIKELPSNIIESLFNRIDIVHDWLTSKVLFELINKGVVRDKNFYISKIIEDKFLIKEYIKEYKHAFSYVYKECFEKKIIDDSFFKECIKLAVKYNAIIDFGLIKDVCSNEEIVNWDLKTNGSYLARGFPCGLITKEKLELLCDSDLIKVMKNKTVKKLIQSDRDFLIKLIVSSPFVLKIVDKETRDSVKNDLLDFDYKNDLNFYDIPDDWFKEKEFVYNVVDKMKIHLYRKIDLSFWNDIDFVKKIFTQIEEKTLSIEEIKAIDLPKEVWNFFDYVDCLDKEGIKKAFKFFLLNNNLETKENKMKVKI